MMRAVCALACVWAGAKAFVVGPMRRGGWGGIIVGTGVLTRPHTIQPLAEQQGAHVTRGRPLFSTAAEPEPDVVEVRATKASMQELKWDLLLQLSGINRGFNIQESERRDIDEAIKLLEAENPNPNPCDLFASRTSPLAGTWRLVYTNAIDVLSLGILPNVVLGRVYQNCNDDGTIVTNVAELQPGVSQLGLFPILGQIGDSAARLKVEARSDIVSPSRITLTFMAARFEPLTFCGMDVQNVLPVPQWNIRTPTNQGYIESTFVDKDMRIGRSPGGSVFVFVRER